MSLDAALRSMIESLQMERFSHNEPDADVISLVQNYISEQEKGLRTEG